MSDPRSDTRTGMSDPQSEDAVERRIVDLEERYVHQERLLEELNAVVVQQSKEIERLRLDLRRLGDRALRGEDEVPNEPPPHY